MLLPDATGEQLLTTPEGVASLLAHNSSGWAHLNYDYRLALNVGSVNEDYWSDAWENVQEALGMMEHSLRWFTPVQRSEVLGCLLEYAVSLETALSTSSTPQTPTDELHIDDEGAVSTATAPGSAIPLVGSATDLANCGCAHDETEPVLHAVHSVTAALTKICGDLLAVTGSPQDTDAAIDAIDRNHTLRGTPREGTADAAGPDPRS